MLSGDKAVVLAASSVAAYIGCSNYERVLQQEGGGYSHD
jgi:hypothetical protein